VSEPEPLVAMFAEELRKAESESFVQIAALAVADFAV